VPNDPDLQALGVRDVENERDDFVNFSWLHTYSNGALVTVSPFYHFNRAHYVGGFDGDPSSDVVVPGDDRGSNYVGGVASVAFNRGRHNARAGIQVFADHENQFFSLRSVNDSTAPLADRVQEWGDVEAIFVEDQFKATSWLTLNGGLRLTHFGSGISENAADPRIGAAIRIPKLGWVLRGSYGRYYQAPPLLTVSGPLLQVAAAQGFSFLPLRGERDEQHEFGLTIPYCGLTVVVANFRTCVSNFFDHDVLGNSNIFFPLTIDRARIRGWETNVNSPRIGGRVDFHLAYSHQYAEGSGAVSGGLTDFTPPEDSLFFLDHDQRNTLSAGFSLSLPWKLSSDFNVAYGSGFLDGDGPSHLPSHTTYDLALQRSFGENWSVRLTGLNLGNSRYLLDNSNTFGGTHYVNPREISVQLKYRFRF